MLIHKEMNFMRGCIVALFITITLTASAQKNTVRSQLTHANVYYGYGAELNHTAKASFEKGTQEIVVENISNALDPNTVQISVPENIVLLSYRYNVRTTVIPHQANPAIKRMQDSLKIMQKLLNGVANETSVVSEMLDKTSKLIESYSGNGNKNLSTADLIKLLDFYTTKIQAYRNTIITLQNKKLEYTETMADISNRLYNVSQENNGSASIKTGEMILQVMAQQTVSGEVGISYFTQNAGWIPTYDMRVKSADNTFKLVYKASVNQNTGLDWKQVKLTLSTSNPNQGSSYPILNPLLIQQFNPQIYREMKERAAASRMMSTNTIRGLASQNVQEDAAPENENDKQQPDDVSGYLTLNEGQLNTSFEIDLPYDIPSDGKAYSVAIKEENIKATYKHYAVPKLDKDAFLLAEISDWENLDLLPGDANIIMDNVYLGKSFIDPNTTLDTLNLSLGRDKRVAVKRMLMKEFSKSKVKGDTKTETFTYEITVKNNKSKEMTMLLKDQVPVSNLAEVVVKVTDDSGAEINEELGVLNWKVTLKPGDTRKIRFSYTVTYPKDKKYTNLR